jgi:hypothetical protein
MTATMTTNSTKIDFNAIVTRAKNGERITVKHLAKEFSMKSVDLRKMLVTHFGANIVFKRGRTGGISFTI